MDNFKWNVEVSDMELNIVMESYEKSLEVILISDSDGEFDASANGNYILSRYYYGYSLSPQRYNYYDNNNNY
jgi:hypothetical protein